MSLSLRSSLLAISLLFGTASGAVFAVEQGSDLPEGTNTLERMHLKHAKCQWTDEIGAYIYQCLKDNFNMNAHWCHNEAMELLCPKQAQATQTGAEVPADR